MAIARKDSSEMIGEISVMPSEGTISLGYTVSYRCHRQGYGYEALSALVELLHRQQPEQEFICFTDPQNTASMGLLKKLGFRDLGYLPGKASRVFGKWLTPGTLEELSQAVTAEE